MRARHGMGHTLAQELGRPWAKSWQGLGGLGFAAGLGGGSPGLPSPLARVP